jgi:four helix bundle protein
MSESVYKKDNLILNLTFDFAIDAITFCELLEERKKFVVARQLLRSATSVGANIREAQNAESKADFIHKMKIAAKEADETEYWLLICKAAKDYPYNEELLEKLLSVIKILNKIISSSKNNNKSSM